MISGPRYKDPADQPTDFNKKKSEMFFVDIYSWGERILTLFFVTSWTFLIIFSVDIVFESKYHESKCSHQILSYDNAR